MLNSLPTGCDSLDGLLGGGLPRDAVSLVYGEAETGKTCLAMQCAVSSARMGYKALFIDSDGTLSTRRMSQIAGHDFEEISPLIILMRPKDFQEQARAIDHLEEYTAGRVGLVVMDTITSLYRVELGDSKETFALNRELNRQVACLAQVAKMRRVAVLMTSQVRSVFVEGRSDVEPVANRVLRFWSDVVVQLKNTGQPRVVKALLQKSPAHKRPVGCYLRIEENGLRGYSSQN